jgi:simple sugar transport system permease protein
MTRASTLSTITGLAAAWVAFCALVWIYGEAPRVVAAELFAGTWGTPYGIGQVLFKATPLLFTGVAIDIALRAGAFNIGAEGQVAVASLAVGVFCGMLGAHTPAIVAIPFAAVVAALAGAAWAFPPAILRARFGAHEVISTIMMNRIAEALVGYVLTHGVALEGTVRTDAIAPGARLPRLDRIVPAFGGSAASAALFVAIAVALAAAFFIARTRAGREMILVGLSPVACEAEKIPVARRIQQAIVLSGAICGLASFATVLGYKGYFESGLGAGVGFGGLAVALLGRGHPVGLLLAALLFGTLQQGGLAINGRVPMEVMDVLQGVVIAAVALADARVRRLLVAPRKARLA